MKVTIGSGIYQTIYHNGSYFLLFKKKMTKSWNFTRIALLNLK